MTYKLRPNMTTLRSRFDKKVEVKMPSAKIYSQCTKLGTSRYPTFTGLKNPSKTSK